jgi:hypothetical protein
MQQQSPSKGTFIALILIVVVSLGIYFYYKGTPTDTGSSLTTTSTVASVGAQAAASRVLILLNTISSLKIDGEIFKSPVYNSLVDYTITIPEQNVGRPNPFAPTGGASVPSSTSIKLPKGSSN